ncbi:MAG: hypothetical protein EOP48_23395 [Sphingobacteriales bacterium]|nr:MAG: hypothetical protein EOP48_23395 [Sphingobacteriales bacterium]
MASSQMNSRSVGMQKNRTLKYKLILDENGTYYLIDRPVLILAYFISDNLWYYPNEFQSGVLNASYRFSKLYNQSDFEKLGKETHYSVNIQKQLYDRAYPFRVDELNEFKLPVFSYWEWLNSEANFMVGNNRFRNYSPGLGTFSVVPKVGIVNASFKPSLREASMPSDKLDLKIRSVNGVSPGEFAELLRNNLYKKMIIGAQ